MTLTSRSRSQAISSENLVTTVTSQAISSENLVSTITQEGSHVGFSNLYQACICKRSRTSLNSGDLDLKVKITGHFF